MKIFYYKRTTAIKRKDSFSSLVSVLLIGALVFYQLLPLSLAVAQEASGTETATEAPASDSSDSQQQDEPAVQQDAGDSSSNETDSSSQSPEDNASDTTEESQAETPASSETEISSEPATPADQTPPADQAVLAAETPADNSSQQETVNPCACQEGNEENNDSESQPNPCTETCLRADVENTNDASAENNAASSANTGNNAIGASPEETSSQTDLTESQPENASQAENGDASSENAATQEQSDNNETSSENGQAGNELCQAEILTGDAAADATVVNEINTNIVTDNGASSIQNIEGNYVGDINLLDTFNSLLEQTQNLNSENNSALQSLVVENNNTADVSNNVSAAANTGENSILGADGKICGNECAGAEISTGDATAVANVINFINTNFVGNTWLFSAINVLGNWTGNLIVPGEGLLTVSGQSYSDIQVVNENEATVENSATAAANTGANSIDSSSSAIIQTGNAVSGALVKNIVNTNIVKNNWFFLLVNNMGSWMGQVINWNQATGTAETVYSYDFSTDGAGNSQSGGSLFVRNQNSADVTNIVSATANTGANNIAGNSSNASTQTGDANAQAKIFNFINTNIVGNNWLFGIVNVFGTWKGNVEFAYPDIAVSMNSDKDSIQPGDELTYTIKYKNNGKAKAENAEVMLSLPEFVSLQSNESEASNDGHDFKWNFSGLDPGEERSLRVTVALDENIPTDITGFESAAGARTNTKEIETGNNSASVDTSVNFPKITILDGDSTSLDSELNIKRQDTPGPVSTGSIIDHAITVKNPSKHTLYDIEVREKIKDPASADIVEYVWTIDKLKKGQSALIEYQALVSEEAQPGAYEHIASAEATDKLGEKVESKKSTTFIEIVAALFPGISNGDESLILPAEAAPAVPPAEAAPDAAAPLNLPLWIWIAAIIAYFLTINWALFPKRKIKTARL